MYHTHQQMVVLIKDHEVAPEILQEEQEQEEQPVADVNGKRVVWINNFSIQWSLTYPDYSVIRTYVWEPIPIHQQRMTHLSGNLGIRTVSEAPL